MTIQLFLSRQWWWTTLLVFAAIGVMTRLGIWQLDRLEQRKSFNARVQTQLGQPPLMLKDEALSADLASMAYREVIVEGEYDHTQEVALRNQVWGSRLGIHLITPLRITDTDWVVLVDRGWVPVDVGTAGDWDVFTEPGMMAVRGIIRASQIRPDIGGRTDPTPLPGEKLLVWNMVNLERIDEQISYSLLPVYIQQAPDSPFSEGESLPYRSLPNLELMDGPHLGYAIQWFLFATVLGIGYPIYLHRETTKRFDEARS